MQLGQLARVAQVAQLARGNGGAGAGGARGAGKKTGSVWPRLPTALQIPGKNLVGMSNESTAGKTLIEKRGIRCERADSNSPNPNYLPRRI